MSEPWDDPARRTLVSGRSCLWWSGAGLIALAMLGVNLAAVVVTAVVATDSNPGHGSTALRAALLALTVTGTAALGCIAAGAVQDIREMRAGYTTAFGWHRDFDQVDPATGEVVRQAGEPLIRRRR